MGPKITVTKTAPEGDREHKYFYDIYASVIFWPSPWVVRGELSSVVRGVVHRVVHEVLHGVVHRVVHGMVHGVVHGVVRGVVH